MIRIRLIHGFLKLAADFLVNVLRVDEVAVATAVTCSFAVLAALGFAEVCDGRILDLNDLAFVELAEHGGQARLSLLLARVLEVEISEQVLADVVGDDHIDDLAVAREFFEHFLEEVLEMQSGLTQVFLRHLESLSEGDGSGRVLIEPGEHERLADGRLVVLARAAVAVAARPDLEVKRAVDSERVSDTLVALTCRLRFRISWRVYRP